MKGFTFSTATVTFAVALCATSVAAQLRESLQTKRIIGAQGTQMVSFFDGDFDPVDWDTTVTGLGSSIASTEADGGNPDSFRQLSMTVAPDENAVNHQLFLKAVYTPATQGPIESVRISYDVKRVSSTHAGATQISRGVSVQQNGVIYRYFGGVTVSTDWEPFEVEDIVPLIPQIDWVDGSQITFGFHNSVSTTVQGFTIVGGYDNFSVEITPSPGPVERLGQTHRIVVNDLGNRRHNRIAVTPDRKNLIINRDISAERFSGVTVVDLETGEISSLLFPEEGRSNGLAIDPQGDRAYVAHTKTSGSIETAGRNRVDCVDITTRPPTLERSLVPEPSLSTQGVTDVAVDPEGKRLYIADRGGARVHVFDIDRDSLTQFEQLASVQVQGVVTSVSVTPDGSRVYAANRNNGTVACIDTSDHTLGGAACGGIDLIPLSFQMGANLTFGAVAPDGKRAYFVYQQAEPCIAVVNTDPDDALFQQEIPGSPISTTAESLFSVALNQDRSLLYTVATNKKELLVIDTRNLKQVQRVTLQVNGIPGPRNRSTGRVRSAGKPDHLLSSQPAG